MGGGTFLCDTIIYIYMEYTEEQFEKCKHEAEIFYSSNW